MCVNGKTMFDKTLFWQAQNIVVPLAGWLLFCLQGGSI